MSHTHSHAPGQPSHSHGPPQQQQQQQQQMVMRPPDPVMQALIEQSFTQVDLTLGPPDNATVLCTPHSLEKCTDCDVDYSQLNRLSKTLLLNPGLRCPPPPNIVSQKLSTAINNTKEEGNLLFKGGQHEKAVQRYTMAANIAAQRPPWEASQLMREELSTILSNRSAAYYELGGYVSALTDAETVIQLKRPWSKGHFRKARALMKLEKFQEAKDAIQLGLSFEVGNTEMTQMLADIDTVMKRLQQSRPGRRLKRDPPPPLPLTP